MATLQVAITTWHCHSDGKFSGDELILIIRGGAKQYEGFANAKTSECTMNLRNQNGAKARREPP